MIEERFVIKSQRQVVLLTLALTAFCVAVPVWSLAILLGGPLFWMPDALYWGILGVTAAIPALLAPPISYLALHILRVQAKTIEKVDEYVRYDALTGVLSRAYLLGRIRDSLKDGGAFLMADADHFKLINDTYGHDVGDEALKKIAEVLRRYMPSEALVGRLGGEEFGVFLPGADQVTAAAAARSLCDGMRKEGEVVAGHPLKMTLSVGIAVHMTQQPLERTMKLADAALYHAKRSGRDRYYIADATETMPALILKSAGLHS